MKAVLYYGCLSAGEDGPPGMIGPKGMKGDVGLQGFKGAEGDIGWPGSPGIKGDTGDDGRFMGVVSFVCSPKNWRKKY